MHSSSAAHIEGKEKKSGRTNGALTFISAKQSREKRQPLPLRAQSFNALGNGRKERLHCENGSFDGGKQTDRPALCLGHDRGMTSALIDIFVNSVKKSM